MQTSDYLNSLQNDKENFATKLTEKGVTLNGNETFTELVPKLDEIQSGGDISEYFYETINNSQTIIDLIRKVPMFIFNGTNMTFMFQNSKAEEIDLSGVGNNVNNMSGTFRYCSKLKKIIGLNDLNTSKVTNISNIFWQSGITTFESDWDTSNVINMEGAFYYCEYLTNLNISSWDMGKVKKIQSFCNLCKKIINLQFGYNLGKSYTENSDNYYEYTLALSSNDITTSSLMSIINGLYDLNLTYDVANGGTLYTQKLTLGATNLAKLTAEEISLATSKGWTVS